MLCFEQATVLEGQHVAGMLLHVYCLHSLVLMPYHSILVGDSGMGRPSPFSSEIKVGTHRGPQLKEHICTHVPCQCVSTLQTFRTWTEEWTPPTHLST